MPTISGWKICRPIWAGKYAGQFGSEKMPEMSDQNKMANSGQEIKMPVFSGIDKIARELTDLL